MSICPEQPAVHLELHYSNSSTPHPNPLLSKFPRTHPTAGRLALTPKFHFPSQGYPPEDYYTRKIKVIPLPITAMSGTSRDNRMTKSYCKTTNNKSEANMTPSKHNYSTTASPVYPTTTKSGEMSINPSL